MIFFTLLAIVAFFSYVEIFTGISEKQKIKILYVLFFVFYCLSFLRWEFGSDWEGYYTQFEYYGLENLDGHELLYIYVLVFARSIINDYTFVLFCFSTILFYFQVKGIVKLSVLPLTSLFVLTGTYFCNVGYARQYIAIAILFYSIVFIINRKFVPFVACILLAFGFHFSALMFFPAYWIFNLKISRKKLLLFIVISMFLSSLMVYFLQGMGNLIGITAIIERTDQYIDQGYDYEDGSSTLDPRQTIIKACFNRGLYILIGLYLVGKESEYKRYFSGLFNLYCFGTILFFLTSPLHITLTRMSWYYDFVQILIVPGVFLYVNKRQRKVVFLLLSVILFLKLYMYANSSDDIYVVYKFIPSIERLLN